MKKRVVIAFFATSLTAGMSFAADWPLMGPQFYPSVPLTPVEWTGIYFGVNAGYGWASGSSTTVFGGGLTNAGLPAPPGTTTPLGLGATELGGTGLFSSSSPRGGIAGRQIGFNWQAGMVVFGAELDAQWSGQSNTVSLICTRPKPGCTASEAIKIRSLTTGRARVGLAFDWLMPYVTAGAALVNARDDLTVNVGGGERTFSAAVEYLARMDGGRRCRCRVIKQLVGKIRVSSHQGQRSHFKCIDTRFPRRGDGGRVGRISRQYRARRLELPDWSPRRSRGAREARVAGLGLCVEL